MKIKANSLKDVFIHLGIILAIGIVLILSFFYIYLPSSTNHGESITVPEITGLHLDDLPEFLEDRELRFEITEDSGFSANQEPLTVLSQVPEPGKKVKENRKIYVTLNATKPPKVQMPRLVDGSVKNAQMMLESYDLTLGELSYEPHEFQNAVLEQRYNGEIIEAGTEIPKGSTIDLVVGNGLGRPFAMPDVLGNSQEDAEFILKGSGLRMGTVHEGQDSTAAPGTVVKQYPEPGESIRIGNRVDIWIKPDTAQNTEVKIMTPGEIE